MVDSNLGELFYKLVLDETDFNKSINNAENRVELFNKKLDRVGKELTTKLTLPILAAGTAAIKMAADAEGAASKFNKAFAGAIKDAQAAVKTLGDSYGYSNTEATRLLANTGDLLKGFNATSEQALTISTRVQMMARDLAVYSNVQGGAAVASQKLTKAMLGETEGLVELGIKLNQADIQQELVRTGQDKLTGQALLLAKAQATLNLAAAQSVDAMGAYARQGDNASVMMEEFKSAMADMASEYGKVLLPAFKSLLGGVTDIVEKLTDAGPNMKGFIITLLGIAAGAGPAVKGIQGISVAIKTLNVLAKGNPLGAIVAGIVALVTAYNGLRAAAEDREIDRKKLWSFMPGIDSIEQGKKDLAEITRLTNQYFKDRDQLAKKSAAWYAADAKAQDAAEKVKQYQAALNLAIAQEKALQEVQTEKAEKEQAAVDMTDAYKTARENVLKILDDEVSEYDKIQKQIDALQKTPWASGKLEEDRLKAIEILKARQKEILDQQLEDERNNALERAEVEAAALESMRAAEAAYYEEQARLAKEARDIRMGGIDDVLKQYSTADQSELEKLEAQLAKVMAVETEWYDEVLDKERAIALLRDQINKETEKVEKEQAAERRKRFQEEFSFYSSQAQNIMTIFSLMSSYQSNLEQTRISNIEAETDALLTNLDLRIDAIKQQAEAGAITRDEEAAQVKALENEKLRAEYEAELAKYEIEKDAFERKKKIAIAEIALNTSIAIIKGYAELGPIKGSIAAILLAGIAAGQIAVATSQQPPQPPVAPTYLQDGGYVPAQPGGVNAVVGEGRDDEVVMPLNDMTFRKLGQAIVDSMQGSVVDKTGQEMNLTIILEDLGQTTLKITQDALNSGVIRVPSRVVVRG